MIEKTLAKWSKAVKLNAGNVCEVCGQDGKGEHGRLESHHIISLRDNPLLKLETENGVCLCHFCHMCAHGGNFTPDKLHASPHFGNGPKYQDIRYVQEKMNELAHERKLGQTEVLNDPFERFNKKKAEESA